MKGMEFKLIADVIIAMAGVILVFSIFTMLLPLYTGTSLCKYYQIVQTLPLPSFLKPNAPQCSITPTTEKINLSDEDSNKILQELTINYIYKCWKDKADSGKSGLTFQCYEIYLKSFDRTITEKDVTDYLKSKGYCDSLPNNFLDQERKSYDCGSENKIYWKIGEIKGNDITIIVKYSAFPIHRIEVI